MARIAVIGTGYVGLTAAVGLANFGSRVVGLDVDAEKIANLQKGIIPFYEDGMKALLDENVKAKRLFFSNEIAKGIKEAEMIFIAVGTPQGESGEADVTSVFEVAEEVARNLNGYKIIIMKSTVPVGTNEKIRDFIQEKIEGRYSFDMVSNPEFLREGKALYDFLHPDRVVIGVDNPRPIEAMRQIYRPLYLNEVPFVITDLRSAEVIKYAANCFLATKVAFINEIARLCDAVGANVKVVAQAMGKDGRIGSKFLHSGPGFGGSCFPKDTNALSVLAKKYNTSLLIVNAAIESNELQKKYSARKIIDSFNGNLNAVKVAVLGLAFKADTDDMRDSAVITIINELLSYGADICVYDPQAMTNARKIWQDKIYFAKDEYDVIDGSDAVVIITEWNQFRGLDLERIAGCMRGNKFFDFRNIYKKKEVEVFGLQYVGIGT